MGGLIKLYSHTMTEYIVLGIALEEIDKTLSKLQMVSRKIESINNLINGQITVAGDATQNNEEQKYRAMKEDIVQCLGTIRALIERKIQSCQQRVELLAWQEKI